MSGHTSKTADAAGVKFTRSQLLTVNALLCAIIIIFIIFPAIGPVKLAVLPIIAVIISAEVVGLKNGIFSGLFFGVISLISSFASPTILSPAFHNPLVSVLPRVFIGITVYFSALGFRKLFPKLNPIFSYAVGSAVGVITNTTLVLGMILLLHFGKTFTFGDSAIVIGWRWLTAIILSNSLIELATCTIITPPIVLALEKFLKKAK